jgi:sugar lactone lactonase YvrE
VSPEEVSVATTKSLGARLAVGAALFGALLAFPGALDAQLRDQTQVAPTNDLPTPYVRVHPWGELPHGAYADRASFIGAEEGPDGSIYLLSRCRGNSCADRPEPPVTKHDPSGRLLASWGSGMMDFPHGFAMDPEGNVWASDQRTHQVYKWSPSGELLMTIGRRGEAGDPPTLLNEPTDVAVARNGNIFVTEGHSFTRGANRVSKFAPDGSFIASWGRTGSGPGEFNVPHTLAFDSLGRVFVGDRGNNRIQIFDQDGNLLDVWYQFGRPSGIAIGADDRIYVADSESWGTDNPGWKKGIRVGSARDGTVHYLIEDLESTAVEHSGAEGVGVDRHGNVFGAVVRRRMLEKHVPGAGVGVATTSADRLDSAAPPGSSLGRIATGGGGKGLTATATTEAGVALLHANFSAGDLSDLAAMQRHAGHVLHALAPEPGSGGPGTGFGLVRWAEEIAEQARMAGEASDASGSLRTHAAHMAAIATTVAARARAAADVARRLREAASIRVASPLVAELRLLVYRIVEGGDEDGDGTLSLDGEAGLQQLEAHVYLALEGEGLPRVIR